MPVTAGGWLDPSVWARDGRGRDWAFSLSTDVLIRALEAVAERHGGRLELLVCSRIGLDRDSYSVYARQPLDELTLEGPWQYFVRSLLLSPDAPAPGPLPGVGWPAVLAVNGLVSLHHPEPGVQSDTPESTIGVVHRVVNQTTGELRRHSEYDELFKQIKREVQRRAADVGR